MTDLVALAQQFGWELGPGVEDGLPEQTVYVPGTGHIEHVTLSRMLDVAVCPDSLNTSVRHDSLACVLCLTLRKHARDRVEEDEDRDLAVASMRVSGGYLFDLPLVAPVWGTPEELLAAEGQGWMVVGPDGTGKTSVACHYSKARLALPGWEGEMWDLPVLPLPPDQSVYYLAMDRSRQMMEAFMRGIGPDLRDVLDRRLAVHKGPPPFRLSRDRGQRWLLREVEATNAGLVVLDSRKDLGSTVDPIEVAGVATAVQLLVNSDVEVLVLAHPVKGRRNGPPSLEDVSGLRDVFSGLGSVVFLDGRPGSPQIDVHQVKPIREVVPPFKVLHDHASGRSERLPIGLVPVGDHGLMEGRSPVNAFEVRVLACIDAHPSGEAPSASLKEVLHSDNLSRDLRALLRAEVIEANGLRGPQAGYRRGPKAPPRDERRATG